MKVKPILEQDQLNRDFELAGLTQNSMMSVDLIKIASPETIAIYKGNGSDLNTPEDVVALYRDFSYINWVGYLKTLMYTSIHRRGKLISFLKTVKNKKCLDHGCGVASHSIVLAELGNDVSIMEVEGPALDFAKRRLACRDHKITSVFTEKQKLPNKTFDVVISVEVLEHVPDPMEVLKDLYRTLKAGGLLYLRYSTMVKNSSGHFKTSIAEIKTYVPYYMKEHFEIVSPGVYKKI